MLYTGWWEPSPHNSYNKCHLARAFTTFTTPFTFGFLKKAKYPGTGGSRARRVAQHEDDWGRVRSTTTTTTWKKFVMKWATTWPKHVYRKQLCEERKSDRKDKNGDGSSYYCLVSNAAFGCGCVNDFFPHHAKLSLLVVLNGTFPMSKQQNTNWNANVVKYQKKNWMVFQ